MATEVRGLGVEAFEEIYPLLQGFANKRMDKEDWRRMLFTYPWWDGPVRGYGLYVDGRVVGFMGTIFSKRWLLGRTERLCNTSAWIVREEYRNASLLLVRPVLDLRDHTVVNLTPSPAASQIFAKLGFKPLESEQLLLPPLPGPAQVLRAARGSFTLAPEELRRRLVGDERHIYEDLSTSPATHHVLLHHMDRSCYLVATPRYKKGVRFAEIQYIGDRDFFWEHRFLAQVALFRAMGAVGLAVDCRFADGRRIPALRQSVIRLYRPSRPEIGPTLIDGLYSELMSLRM